ncbi:MAG: RNA polymerase sigma factor, partial [Gaiellaceae bacterium]
MAIASRAIRLPVPRDRQGSSDRLLVARVASGDDRAFEEIFDRYGPALLSFCAHMLGSREWGEDALQLTFVAAYKALRRGGCDGELRPWLYAIARNRCVSELRARREIPDSDRVCADRPASDGPASLFARREQLREVVEDIQRLPADQRAALVLFELGDQSHAEIASVLGVRRDKVKALIFQAREGLYRGRSARESACSDVRELLANARGIAPARGVVRAHVD